MGRAFFMHGPIFIVGATSVGKSNLALELAQRAGGEVVNADAFQIYDGLNLLTSKPSGKARGTVPHHLFGTVPLWEPYNVARYRAEAMVCIDDIRRRGRAVIVVGGTGLYVKALTHGLSTLPPPDFPLRERLEAKDLDELQAELQKVDPVAMRQIDLKNKRRLVRALEVSLATGTPFSSHCDAWSHSIYGHGEAGVFLDRGRDELRARIDRQVDLMFDAGVVEEVHRLDPAMIGDTVAGTIGLTEIKELLAGRLSLPECKEQIKIRTRQYAKRQITWFKREHIFRRILLSEENTGVSEAIDALHTLLEANSQGRILPFC